MTIISSTYKTLRRQVQKLVNSSKLLDSTVGNVIRRIERKHIPLDRIMGFDKSGVLQVMGSSLHYRPCDEGVVAQLLLHGEYEPETTAFFTAYLKPGMVFFDLGAHIGFFTLLAARLVGPSGRVYAFEPMNETRQLLELNIQENDFADRVTVAPYAVSDKSRILHFDSHPKESVSAKMALANESGPDVVEVKAVSLDDFTADMESPRVDLIKMDIEGCETEGLRGMRRLAASNPEMRIIFEFNEGNFTRYGSSPLELFQALENLGFTKYRVLWRMGQDLELPREMDKLMQLAKLAPLNILAEKSNA